MLKQPALLALANGNVFKGTSIGAKGTSTGELVFNTSMTGYQEMLTDPSYAKQILTLTSAHVGNTGCNEDDLESSRVWAAGLVIRNDSPVYSNYRSTSSLSDWLKKHNVVAISDIDTRALTLMLRDQGAMNACITTHAEAIDEAILKAQSFSGLQDLDLAKVVSRQTKERWHEGNGHWGLGALPETYHVVVYDFGVKHSILRYLHDLGCHITLVPAETSVEEVLSMNPQGIFLSNGPGDPKACHYAIEATKVFIDIGLPVLGICLGFQIIGLACGAQTLKMKFGHHGANHPVIELSKSRVFITSQNHGFTIDELTLPSSLEITHRSLFDHSIQGIKHKNKPVFALQGHPESSPGPHDMLFVFNDFLHAMKQFNQ